ncbi:MAG: hypothetical protein SOW56_04425 [Bacteroidaceae bacterium]|nr:hypothetical protein [Prevotellaceae bacterium]MDY3063259.1 hypothetical protein [Bacteroidaceae bacterium]
MKKLLLLMVVALTMTTAFGQVEKAKSLLDEIAATPDDAKLAEAKKAINEAIANAKPNKLAYIYNVAGQVELRYLNQEIDKMQAEQPLDTALFISCMDKAVEYFTKSYEIDHTPDAKGRVKPKFDYGDKYTIGEHDGNLVWMKRIIGYYLISAQFCYKNGDKHRAYEYYMKHLSLPKSPLFTPAQRDSIYKSDSRYPLVGYYATILVFQDKDYDKVLQTVDYAIQSTDETTREDGYHMKSTALLQKGDTAKWLATLKDAMENTNNVNYPQIILKYYYDRHEQAEASKIADEFVAKAPNNKMAHYIKGVVLMDEGKDLEARKCFQDAVAIDENFAEAVSNIGVTYFNEVRELNQKATTDNKDPKYKAQQEELKAKLLETKGYFDKVQTLAPGNPDLWEAKLNNINSLLDVVNTNLSEIAKRDKK